MIENYKKMKEKKKKEELDRIQMQNQVKKNRGRQHNSINRKEIKFTSCGSKDYKCDSQSDIEHEVLSLTNLKI